MEKNIAKAVDAEREYLNKRAKGEDVNIQDYLSPCGYDNLEEFHVDKTWFLIKSSNIVAEDIHITKSSLNKCAERMTQKEPFFIFANTETKGLKTVAIIGKDNSDITDEDFLDAEVYPIHYNYGRGTIITGIKDVNFGLSFPREYGDDLSKDILKRLKTYFEKTNTKVTIDANDILINNRKVVGMTDINNPYCHCLVVHVSLTDYTDLIYELCPPHGNKLPGYIDNITKEELTEEIKSWLVL